MMRLTWTTFQEGRQQSSMRWNFTLGVFIRRFIPFMHLGAGTARAA